MWAFQVALVVKNLPANAGDVRDVGSIPQLGRPPEEGNGFTLLLAYQRKTREPKGKLKKIYSHPAETRTNLNFLPRVSSVAQTVKHLSTMWKTWVRSLGQEDSPGEGNGNPLQ